MSAPTTATVQSKVKTIRAKTKTQLGQEVLANAACMGIHFTGLSWSRRIDLTDIVQGDRGRDIKFNLDLIDTKHPDVKVLGYHTERFRNWMKGRALPADILPAGTYMVPLGLVETVVARVEEEDIRRRELIENLLSKYDLLKDEAKQRTEDTVRKMTEQYKLNAEQTAQLVDVLNDESQYPTPDEIRQRFGIELRYYDCSVPEQLAKVNSRLHAAALERFNADVAVMYEEIKVALREGFAKLVSHLVGRLSASPDGEKAKGLRSGMLDNLLDFLATFEQRNLVNDTQLMALVEKARKVMHGVSVEDLKSLLPVRQRIVEEMSKINAEVDKNLKTKAVRKIKLSASDDE
jgi:hypothetical protein